MAKENLDTQKAALKAKTALKLKNIIHDNIKKDGIIKGLKDFSIWIKKPEGKSFLNDLKKSGIASKDGKIGMDELRPIIGPSESKILKEALINEFKNKNGVFKNTPIPQFMNFISSLGNGLSTNRIWNINMNNEKK